MKPDKEKCRTLADVLAIAALAALLAACTGPIGPQEDRVGRFLVGPDKYTLYDCAQLAEAAAAAVKREGELRALMARAGGDSGGRLVSAMAYRPEYYQVHGEINEMRRSAAEKKCDFVPGADIPIGPLH